MPSSLHRNHSWSRPTMLATQATPETNMSTTATKPRPKPSISKPADEMPDPDNLRIDVTTLTAPIRIPRA